MLETLGEFMGPEECKYFTAEEMTEYGRQVGQAATLAPWPPKQTTNPEVFNDEEGRTFEMPLNICRVGVRRTGPDSFQWCPATGQGATGTN